MNMKLRNIPFSPPDMTEAEAKEVREAILSGWITTGPRTKNSLGLDYYWSSYKEVGKSDFGICAHGQDSMSELCNGSTGDGAAPAGYSAG